MERREARRLLRAVGAQDQIEKRSLLFFDLLAMLFFTQVRVDADVVLPLVLAQIEDFKGSSGSDVAMIKRFTT